MKNMTKYINKNWLLATLIALFSCEGFLEQEPLDSEDADSFYSLDEGTANQAVLGIYNAFYKDGMYKRNIWMAQELGSDNAYLSNPFELDDYNITPNNGEMWRIWQDHYDLINRAQHVIEKVPATPMAMPTAKNCW